MAERGRPSDYTDDLADLICERLATGESLRAMCRDDDVLPCERTVYRWLLSNQDFCQKYARAREFQSEPHLEDIIEIADRDDLEPNDKKVRIDTRKWAMSKLAPKKYGDKIQQEIVGANGGAIQVNTTAMSAEEAYNLLINGGTIKTD